MDSRRLLVLVLALSGTLPLISSPWLRAQQVEGKRKVTKTDKEWQKLLTTDEYAVTRQKATEPAFSGKYAESHAKGTYACVCCSSPLFSSQAKFDSGTGWPSFWKPIDPKKIDAAQDNHQAEARIEVMCQDCGAHLGHVFDDGPPPTGLRYCINSLSLKLVPANAAAAPASKKGAKAKGKAKPKSEPKEEAPAETKAAPLPDEPKAAEEK